MRYYSRVVKVDGMGRSALAALIATTFDAGASPDARAITWCKGAER